MINIDWFSVAHEEVIAMNNSYLICRGSNRSGYVGIFQRLSRAQSFLRYGGICLLTIFYKHTTVAPILLVFLLPI